MTLNIPQFIPWTRRPIRPDFPTCSICNEPVEMESGKADEDGHAVHEECYLHKLGLTEMTPRPKPSRRAS